MPLPILLVILVAVVGFAVLFGLGVLRQNAVSNYIVYVVLGGFASLLTFGILTSTASADTDKGGFKIQLTGAVVPFLLIVGGGAYFEQMRGTATVKFKFVDESGNSVKVTGVLRLEAGGYTPSSSPFKESDVIAFDNVPNNLVGKAATLSLDSAAASLAEPGGRYTLDDETHPVRVRLTKATALSGTLSLDGALMSSGSISVLGTNCTGPVASGGFFSVPCPDLVLPATVKVTLDAVYGAPCPSEVSVTKLGNNVLALAKCEEPVPPDVPPPPPPHPWCVVSISNTGTATPRQTRPSSCAVTLEAAGEVRQTHSYDEYARRHTNCARFCLQ